MAGIATLAQELGHRVTGADANAYPPMSDYLRTVGIPITEGWAEGCGASAPETRPDVVVIGNALSRGNPSVEFVLDNDIPYTSGPAWLAANVLAERHVIAIAGTHGKTTTSSLVAWLLEYCGTRPVVDKFRTLIEERGVVLIGFDDKVTAVAESRRRAEIHRNTTD